MFCFSINEPHWRNLNIVKLSNLLFLCVCVWERGGYKFAILISCNLSPSPLSPSPTSLFLYLKRSSMNKRELQYRVTTLKPPMNTLIFHKPRKCFPTMIRDSIVYTGIIEGSLYFMCVHEMRLVFVQQLKGSL